MKLQQHFHKVPLTLAISSALALPIIVSAAPGDPVGGEFRVNVTTASGQNFPAVARDADGDFVVAWQGYGPGDLAGVFARRFNAAGVAQGGEFRVNTTTAGGQFLPAVARDADGDFVVAWQGNGPGDADGIFARRYNASGVVQGGEFRVNTSTTGFQDKPTISLDADGDFVVAWQGPPNRPGDTHDIFAQRYNAAGVAQGGELLVNNFTAGTQFSPTLALDADGDFVVAWRSFNSVDNTGINVRRFNTAGLAQGTEFVVLSPSFPTVINQYEPTIALDADGDFVVAWEVYGQDGPDVNSYGILAQRYNSVGAAQGGVFRVNTTTANRQTRPAVALDADGDFVVAWESKDQDGSSYGVYAQRYSAAGVAQGGEFRVNTTTLSNQRFPAIAIDADGDFVVAWQSINQDGSGYGVYAQRYAGTPVLCGGLAATMIGTNSTETLTGTAGNDVINGLGGNDTINGLGGNDTLCGDVGNDTLDGGDGNDTLLGQAGNDVLNGGVGIDAANFTGTLGVIVNLTANTASGQGTDTLSGIENVTGSSAADSLTGSPGNNLLNGGLGNDTINGAAGIDTASFPGTAAIIVNLTTGAATGQGSDTLSNMENLNGSNGNDTLTGNVANNALNGLGGNDTLNGDAGNDALNGGLGTDTCNGQAGTGDTATACETITGVP